MKAIQIRRKPFDAEECLEYIQYFREERAAFIRENADLDYDLATLENALKDARYDKSESCFFACQDAFGRVLARLEEIAEDNQRLYDESPLVRDEGAFYQSTKDFEVKRDLERYLAALL